MPRPIWIMLLLVCAWTAGPARAAPLTLEAFYAAALRRSEVVATQVELITQAEERTRQALATMLPNLNGVGTFNRLDPGSPSVTPPLSSSTHTSKLAVTQSVTRGFREFAVLRQARALREAQNDDLRQARALLYRDVVQSFYTVLALEQDLRNLEEEIRQNLEREKDINARIRIGRSRVSEVLNVQTTISTLRALVESQRGQLQVARENFAFLSGMNPATPLQDNVLMPEPPEPLENYLAGVTQRPDVRANEQRAAAAREAITVAERAHLPSLDLNGNYYLERTGDPYDSRWDAQLVLTVPLYAGGGTESRRRETVSQRVQADLALSQVRRLAEQDIRSTYESVMYDRSQITALERSTEAARKSYEAQVREYALGLVTNLEVLQALTSYLENRRALDRARFTLLANHERLLAAAARRPLENTPPAP